MSRNTTRIQNLTLVTTLADGDIIPTGPVSGDVAKGIKFSDLKTLVEASDPETIVFINSLPYTMTGLEDIVVFTVGPGNLNLISKDDAVKSVTFYAESGTITVLPAGSETTQQANITTGNSYRTGPGSNGWISL